jgi:hypothetical protein
LFGFSYRGNAHLPRPALITTQNHPNFACFSQQIMAQSAVQDDAGPIIAQNVAEV